MARVHERTRLENARTWRVLGVRTRHHHAERESQRKVPHASDQRCRIRLTGAATEMRFAIESPLYELN